MSWGEEQFAPPPSGVLRAAIVRPQGAGCLLQVPGEGTAVTAPTPALFDPAAADTDRTNRERHQATREAEMVGWAAQARADRVLIADLGTFYADCPAGHLDALEAEVTAATADVAELDAELEDLQRQAAALERAEEADAETEAALAEQVSAQAELLDRLQALVEKVATLPALRERSAELAERIADLDTEVDRLDAAAVEQEALRDRATTDAAEAKAAHPDWLIMRDRPERAGQGAACS